MNKYKSDDYKMGVVKYYLNHNDSMDKVCGIFDCKKSTLKGWIDRYKTSKNLTRKNRINHILFDFYSKQLFRKLKFGRHINIKHNEQKMMSDFRKMYGNPEEVVICIGDWEQRKQMKYKEPTL